MFSDHESLIAVIHKNENNSFKNEINLMNHKGVNLQSLVLCHLPQHKCFRSNKIVLYFDGNVILW